MRGSFGRGARLLACLALVWGGWRCVLDLSGAPCTWDGECPDEQFCSDGGTCRYGGRRSPTCSDGVDNDDDGPVDLSDPGCTGPNDDSEREPGIPCDDGADNDGDGDRDFSAGGGGDDGCRSPLDVSEREVGRTCDDGLDNDCDGQADYTRDGGGDLGCDSANDTSERSADLGAQCDDGLDDDGDGLIDFLSPGCSSPPPDAGDPQCDGPADRTEGT